MHTLKRHTGLLHQIALLFVVGVILIGLLSSLILYSVVSRNMHSQLSSLSQSTSADLEAYIRQFPANEWLLQYWFEHADTLDIDYYANYLPDSTPSQKLKLLTSRHPDFQPDYAQTQEVEALPEEDQKLYAEVIYSWVLTRFDQLKQFYDLEYLFCFTLEDSSDSLFFLFNAGEPGAERGTGPNQVYPLGTVFPMNDWQEDAICDAVSGKSQLVLSRDGEYLDYYYSIGSFDGRELLIGLTRSAREMNHTVRTAAVQQSLWMALFLVFLAVVCLLMILYVVLHPLKGIQKNIRLYKDTKDSDTVRKNLSEIKSRNEFAALSDDVIQLTREIDDYLLEIKKNASERERINTELGLASRIQAAMLPREFPERKDFELFASMTPAREVGGDFYDFFLTDDRHLCMVIADVSGKGVPAALFMMASKITLSHEINTGKSPGQILTDANTSICSRNREEMFVTVWLGILDLETGVLTAANAGHEFPMLTLPDGKFELVKDRHGFVLGGMDGMQYQEYQLQLEPGSRLFLYTDGLAEATNPENEMFGTERILDVLNQCPEENPSETINRIKKEVSCFVREAEPFDDLTLMCLTWHGQAE